MKKAFDCVAMKDVIQSRLLKQMKGLSFEQQAMSVRDALEHSCSPIGKLWRTLQSQESGKTGCVAEAGADYGSSTDADRDVHCVRKRSGVRRKTVTGKLCSR
jgi:hypothetical protein